MRHLIPTIMVATTALFTAVGSASAHIQAFPTTNGSGTEALVSFTIPHGCDDKDTTKIEVNFPKEFVSVRGVNTMGWTATGGSGGSMAGMSHGDSGDDAMSSDDGHDGNDDAMSDDMDHEDPRSDGDAKSDGATAADSGDGMVMSEDGSHTVTWTADKPLPHADLGVVQAYIVVPTSDEQLWMPVVQTCVGGGTMDWTTREEGADTPAPSLEFAAASSKEMVDHDTDDSDDADDDSMETGVIVAIVLGALGTLLGLVAVVRGRKD
jgi:uncharacterized protein YcnI